MIFLSVHLSVTLVICAEMSERIELAFGTNAAVDLYHIML